MSNNEEMELGWDGKGMGPGLRVETDRRLEMRLRVRDESGHKTENEVGKGDEDRIRTVEIGMVMSTRKKYGWSWG